METRSGKTAAKEDFLPEVVEVRTLNFGYSRNL